MNRRNPTQRRPRRTPAEVAADLAAPPAEKHLRLPAAEVPLAQELARLQDQMLDLLRAQQPDTAMRLADYLDWHRGRGGRTTAYVCVTDDGQEIPAEEEAFSHRLQVLHDEWAYAAVVGEGRSAGLVAAALGKTAAAVQVRVKRHTDRLGEPS